MTDNINNLPAPSFIERDADKVTNEIVALYEQLSGKTLYPAQADRIFVDVIAHREMLLRISINEAGKQNLLQFATGVHLDYLGDFFGVVRLDGETDKQLRERIRLAPESYATTGSRQAYIYHALSTDARIIDAQAVRLGNGHIEIYILTHDGTASPQLIQAVIDNTSDEKKRPLSDTVTVQNAEAIEFELQIEVTPSLTANPTTVFSEVESKLQEYAQQLTQKLSQDVIPSQIIGLLSSSNIYEIKLKNLKKTLTINPNQYAKLTSQITVGTP